MECRDSQFFLRLRRYAADELGPEVAAELERHLAACPACAADARSAASFDRAMATAMRAVPVPPGLREQLIAHVASKQGAILRRKLYRTAVVAAASFVLVCLGLGIFSSARPRLETQALVEDADAQWSNPAEATYRWLGEQRCPDGLPLPFNYKLLTGREFANVQGVLVPVITFSSPTEQGGFAKVYIFREDGRFDLKNLRDAQGSHSSAEVLIGQNRFRGFTYVIIVTGGGPHSLDQYLIGGPAS